MLSDGTSAAGIVAYTHPATSNACAAALNAPTGATDDFLSYDSTHKRII
jgi:hypothetical protein